MAPEAADNAPITPSTAVRWQIDRGEPLEFGHTLEDQIGGQIAAGFVITGFYEDRHRDDPIAAYKPTLIATRATKPYIAPLPRLRETVG